MPQMFPLNWIYLYMFFSFIFMLFNILNYFNFLKKVKSTTYTPKVFKNKFLPNWKW